MYPSYAQQEIDLQPSRHAMQGVQGPTGVQRDEL